MQIKKKTIIQLSKYLLSCLLLISCDFSSQLHKKILEAQENINNQNYIGAIKKYEDILKQEPNESVKLKINYQLGELYSLHSKDSDKAAKHFEAVIKITDNPGWQRRAMERSADIYFSYLNNFHKSAEYYNKLINLKYTDARPVDFYEYRYALSLVELNQEEKAIKILKKIKDNPNHNYYVDAFFQLGLIKFSQKKWAKSIQWLKEFLKRETNKNKVIDAKFLIGNAYETMERLKEAYEIYYSILGFHPNSQVIQNRLQAIYERRIARKR